MTALRKNRKARKKSEKLAYTHRREYAQWVGEAKKEETRKRRAAIAVEQILNR